MTPRPQIDHIRRPQLLAAAAEVIAERGMGATRIADVAERVGHQPGRGPLLVRVQGRPAGRGADRRRGALRVGARGLAGDDRGPGGQAPAPDRRLLGGQQLDPVDGGLGARPARRPAAPRPAGARRPLASADLADRPRRDPARRLLARQRRRGRADACRADRRARRPGDPRRRDDQPRFHARDLHRDRRPAAGRRPRRRANTWRCPHDRPLPPRAARRRRRPGPRRLRARRVHGRAPGRPLGRGPDHQARDRRRPAALQLGPVHGPRHQEAVRGEVRGRGQRGQLRQPRGDGDQAPQRRELRPDLAQHRVRLQAQQGGPAGALRPRACCATATTSRASTTVPGGTRTTSSGSPTPTTRPGSPGATTRSRG